MIKPADCDFYNDGPVLNDVPVSNGENERNDVISPPENFSAGSNVLEEEVLQTSSAENLDNIVNEVADTSDSEVVSVSSVSENSNEVKLVEPEAHVPKNSAHDPNVLLNMETIGNESTNCEMTEGNTS